MVWIRVRVSISCISAIKTLSSHENDNRLLFQMTTTVPNGNDRLRKVKLCRGNATSVNSGFVQVMENLESNGIVKNISPSLESHGFFYLVLKNILYWTWIMNKV